MRSSARRTSVGLLWGLILALVLAGCGGTDEPGDGGDDAEDGGIDQCVVDNSQPRPSMEAAWKLEPGGAGGTGEICPRGDADYYWFVIEQPGTILSVNLGNNVSMSPVDLCYTILPQSESDPVVGRLCDHDGLDGVTDLRGTHYLAAAGNYFLEVRDEGGDEQDARNSYALTIATLADPDTYEPNNDAASAKTLGNDPGYISFLGDRDWFKIESGSSGQILSIDLTTTGAAPVDLQYSLYAPDGTTFINGSADTDGMNGATSLHDVLALPGTGTYYVMIADVNDDDSDLTVGYTLRLSLQADPDVRDRSPRNDGVDTATALVSGTAVTDAYLATRADEDWYKIESPYATSDTNPALLEIDLVVDSGSPVDPAVDLLVADPYASCNPGDECLHLEQWSCGGCGTDACRDAECPSHECDFTVGKCRGAGYCLPRDAAASARGCGILSLFMHGADWSTTGDVRHLHTVAPMFGKVYYVVVRDFQGDDLDTTRPYRLTVTVLPEQDTHESPPNGVYMPYATDEQEEETIVWNRPLAKSVSCADLGDHLECGPITGYLSFRGDQDWFKLESIPTEPETTPQDQSTMMDYDLQFDWQFAGNSELYINYHLFLGGSDRPWTGFNHQGTGSGTFGDDECSYLCGEYQSSRPGYLRVQHSNRKKWDYDNPYTITVRVNRLCPQVCSYCQPGVTDYACPNPLNTNPQP